MRRPLGLPVADWLLICAAAALLNAAYPPYTLPGAAFVCLVPAALLILRGVEDPSPARRLFLQGFWYGTLTHGVLMYWLGGALWSYGRGSIVLYPAIAAAFGLVTAAMFAMVGVAVRRSPARLVLVLPAGIIAVEWIAARVGPGFPWHQLALTLASMPFLVQPADVLGAEGLGWMLAIVNVAIALAWRARTDLHAALRHLEVAGVVMFVALLYGAHRWYTLTPQPGARVALVQPNVGPHDKWATGWQDRTVDRTMRLAQEAVESAAPALVAFPETALPQPLSQRPDWNARITQLAHRSGTPILTGGVEAVASGTSPPRRYNAALAFDPHRAGDPTAVHRKRKLVPFIERAAPRADLTSTGFGGFSPGGAPTVSESAIGRYGVLLCYELTFPGEARRLRRLGADVVFTLSNDAWFARTAAPYQHFAHAVLRAVENRVTVVRAANSGISGVVDPLGRVVASTKPFVETYVAARVTRPLPMPLAAHLGELVGPAAIALVAISALLPTLFAPRVSMP